MWALDERHGSGSLVPLSGHPHQVQTRGVRSPSTVQEAPFTVRGTDGPYVSRTPSLEPPSSSRSSLLGPRPHASGDV